MERRLRNCRQASSRSPYEAYLESRSHEGWFGLMPAVYDDVIGAKLVTVFPQNASRGLHTHDAIIHLFRTETGEPLAILGGRVITALRTAAVSALATRELANPNARVLAILGSGVQARTHYRALSLVRSFEDVRVWSRTPEHAAKFADEIRAAATSAEEAVPGADVVVTVTNSSEPILRGAWLKQGAHVNAVGAVGPKPREIDDHAMRDAAIVVESREAAMRESADHHSIRRHNSCRIGRVAGAHEGKTARPNDNL